MESRFISEPVEVEYEVAPLLAKRPGCPDRFTWQDQVFHVQRLLAEWHDYGRRGRFARNMQPQHLRVAERRGSWGVGRFFFKVETNDERVFELYYDRAPASADDRSGAWILYREWVDESGRQSQG